MRGELRFRPWPTAARFQWLAAWALLAWRHGHRWLVALAAGAKKANKATTTAMPHAREKHRRQRKSELPRVANRFHGSTISAPAASSARASAASSSATAGASAARSKANRSGKKTPDNHFRPITRFSDGGRSIQPNGAVGLSQTRPSVSAGICDHNGSFHTDW